MSQDRLSFWCDLCGQESPRFAKVWGDRVELWDGSRGELQTWLTEHMWHGLSNDIRPPWVFVNERLLTAFRKEEGS